MDKLTKQELRNHSNYHLFNIRDEDGVVKFRGKQFIFDADFTPKCGIKIIEDSTTFEPVPAAKISLDKLDLDKVRSHLASKYLTGLQQEDKMRVQSSWDRLLDGLERLEARTNFDAMKISDFPKSNSLEEILPPLPEGLVVCEDDLIPELEGEHFPSHLNEKEFEREIIIGPIHYEFDLICN